jgi:aconitate hydratase
VGNHKGGAIPHFFNFNRGAALPPRPKGRGLRAVDRMKDVLSTLSKLKNGKYYYSLKSFAEKNKINLTKLPISIRVMLESVIRNADGKKITNKDALELANWDPSEANRNEVPFTVSRVLLQDFTGVPLLVDLAAMRDACRAEGKAAELIEPNVPVNLVVDHSVQVDRAGTADAFDYNLKEEYERNLERYAFLKWGQQAFKTLKIIPPGIGICHQVNLELLATLVTTKEIDGKQLQYLDTLVGTDSHTTMINGLGVVGWGVGGIEAEAAMLGQPVFIQAPDVVGFHMHGRLKEGVTATDLTLYVTQILRKNNVVGKFVEFFGEGARTLSVADRATIANMAPEYGATMGFFPADDKTLEYMLFTGRSPQHVAEVKDYLSEQGLFGIPGKGEIHYSQVVDLDLSSCEPCVAGPKRPQDRINISSLKESFRTLLEKPVNDGGYGLSKEECGKKVCVHSEGSFALSREHITGGTSKLGVKAEWSETEMVSNRPITSSDANPGYIKGAVCDAILSNGSIVVAAITSCTNTSNPSVMIAAGLVAKKALEKGLKVCSCVKTSLAPGSRVVTDYLEKTGLNKPLDELGFNLVAYGCTTCIGNSGPLDETIEQAIKENQLVTASVLSGNRNFEARIHGSIKANFLMSPPLVVAYAIAGRIDIDLTKEPLGHDQKGKPVYLKDIWPKDEEIQSTLKKGLEPRMFTERYKSAEQGTSIWQNIKEAKGSTFSWDGTSTYIRKPPYFDAFKGGLPKPPKLENMRVLALFGDSVTTDHISPAGEFKKETPAGKYLINLGVDEKSFNSYGSRRGNHEVMMRGTFANVRIRNKLAGGKEGGWTKYMPSGELLPIFDACSKYAKDKVSLIVFGGKDYGMGSSRDWAAKGAALLGVRVVVAESFERIHRSNLIGMGVLPLEWVGTPLAMNGDEICTVEGVGDMVKAGQHATLVVKRTDGSEHREKVLVRIDTSIECDYYAHGGIMPYVLRQKMV